MRLAHAVPQRLPGDSLMRFNTVQPPALAEGSTGCCMLATLQQNPLGNPVQSTLPYMCQIPALLALQFP